MRFVQESLLETNGNLIRRFNLALAWGAVGVITGRALQFVTTLVMARLLVPEDFGALAVALVVQTIAVNVTDLGATAAIARAGRESTLFAPTVLTVALVTGALLTAAVAGTAPLLANTMGNPTATPVIQAMSLTIALAGVSGVPAAFVWRDYRQGRKAAVETLGGLAGLAVAILLAMVGWGPMALAWSRVAGQAVTTVGYWMAAPVRVRPGFRRPHAAVVLRLGLPLAGANLVVFMALNTDYAVIGRILGPEPLGYYLMAFTLAALPSSLVTASVRAVAVPSFGRLHAAGVIHAAARDILFLVCCVALPLAALIAALGRPTLVFLYGAAWAPAAAALLGLGVFGGGRIVAELLADLCVGAGHTSGLFWVQVMWLALLVPGLWAAALVGGIAAVGWAHAAIIWIAVIPIYLCVAARAVGAGFGEVARTLGLPVAAACVSGTAALGVHAAVEDPTASLLIGAVAGMSLALLICWSQAIRAWRRFSAALGAVRGMDSVPPVGGSAVEAGQES
ncbi:oligosaccharide flippase family protein [Sinomonas atrocyanea]|uniref:oligosaccharide flippase family protein n=1 Tax=Sinomonas atrocyanea TaxID=37927 RepID=UPI003D989A60